MWLLFSFFLVFTSMCLKNCPLGTNKVFWIELDWITVNGCSSYDLHKDCDLLSSRTVRWHAYLNYLYKFSALLSFVPLTRSCFAFRTSVSKSSGLSLSGSLSVVLRPQKKWGGSWRLFAFSSSSGVGFFSHTTWQSGSECSTHTFRVSKWQTGKHYLAEVKLCTTLCVTYFTHGRNSLFLGNYYLSITTPKMYVKWMHPTVGGWRGVLGQNTCETGYDIHTFTTCCSLFLGRIRVEFSIQGFYCWLVVLIWKI